MALNWAAAAEVASTFVDQPVVEALVIWLEVIVLDVLADDSLKVAFPQRDHLGHTL